MAYPSPTSIRTQTASFECLGCRQSQGFTLLELLIAITIFAILATFVYSGLKVVLDTGQHTSIYNQRMSKLQLGLNLIQRDIEQLVNRPIRDEHGDTQPALMSKGFSGVMLELTRGGYSNPMSLPRSNLQRVGYQYQDETLYRLSWPMVDRPQESEPHQQILIEEITSLEIFFYDNELKKTSEWPPRTGNSDTDTAPELPVAIELILELKDWGRIRRLFRSTQSLPVQTG